MSRRRVTANETFGKELPTIAFTPAGGDQNMRTTCALAAALLALSTAASANQWQDDSSFGWDGDGAWVDDRGGNSPKAGAADGMGYSGVPVNYLPPPGLCRVWLGNRSASEQPQPTDCDRARRLAQRVAGRVIYGPQR
jgi:hypothetical protein